MTVVARREHESGALDWQVHLAVCLSTRVVSRRVLECDPAGAQLLDAERKQEYYETSEPESLAGYETKRRAS